MQIKSDTNNQASYGTRFAFSKYGASLVRLKNMHREYETSTLQAAGNELETVSKGLGNDSRRRGLAGSTSLRDSTFEKYHNRTPEANRTA